MWRTRQGESALQSGDRRSLVLLKIGTAVTAILVLSGCGGVDFHANPGEHIPVVQDLEPEERYWLDYLGDQVSIGWPNAMMGEDCLQGKPYDTMPIHEGAHFDYAHGVITITPHPGRASPEDTPLHLTGYDESHQLQPVGPGDEVILKNFNCDTQLY
jgi:hypothetical protein